MSAAADRPDLRWITTERLVGERIGAQHHDLLVAVWSDPRVTVWLGGPQDDAVLEARYERHLSHWAEYGYGLWALRERGTGAFVGYAGLAVTDVPGYPTVEVAYALLPSFWRRGLATEITRHLLGVAFDQLGLTEVVGFTMVTNEGSRGVLASAGLVYERELDHADLPHVLYRVTRPAG
jgi:RimJ/RimL family protein N-acetyltransferase